MARIDLSEREKKVVQILTLCLFFFVGLWVGESYRPFQLTTNAAHFVAGQLERETVNERTASLAAKRQPTTTAAVYEVRHGDTIYGLSQRFGVHQDAIKFFNNMTDDQIYVGQKLLIP